MLFFFPALYTPEHVLKMQIIELDFTFIHIYLLKFVLWICFRFQRQVLMLLFITFVKGVAELEGEFKVRSRIANVINFLQGALTVVLFSLMFKTFFFKACQLKN